MKINYKQLWKILIDRDMKKQDLGKAAGISTSTIEKLGCNENVNIDVLAKLLLLFSSGDLE